MVASVIAKGILTPLAIVHWNENNFTPPISYIGEC